MVDESDQKWRKRDVRIEKDEWTVATDEKDIRMEVRQKVDVGGIEKGGMQGGGDKTWRE